MHTYMQLSMCSCTNGKTNVNDITFVYGSASFFLARFRNSHWASGDGDFSGACGLPSPPIASHHSFAFCISKQRYYSILPHLVALFVWQIEIAVGAKLV